MSAQWFNPMTDTPEGLLLADVQDLLKSIVEKKTTSKQYKSDRGQRKAPELPTPKGNKNKISKRQFDGEKYVCGLHEIALDEDGGCSACADDPECAPLKMDKTTEILQEMGIVVKNTTCNSMCMEDDEGGSCETCYPKSKELKKQSGRCNKCGSAFSEHDYDNPNMCWEKEGGKELKKYSQESSVENLFPQFQNVDGGMPVNAHGFTTNGTYPATNDGPKKSTISETAKIPAYAQKGYTAKSSSLHMHYNDAGGTRKNPPNIDTIEQRLASLTKHAGRNNLGMIGEIEGLLKQVKDHLAKEEKPKSCGDCGRPSTHSARGGTVNRCDRCWPGDDFE